MTDPALYQRVIDDVAAGQNYYDAVATEHRVGHFPLKPFVTVRLPTLALLSARLGPDVMRAMLVALIVMTVLAWRMALAKQNVPRPIVYGSVIMIAGSGAILALPVLGLFHESWAALLIALSLALRRSINVAASVALGLAALLVRETALPYALLMLALAAWDGRWREVAGWLSAILVFAAYLYLHALAVASVVKPDDLATQGWTGMGGWPLYLSTMAHSTPLAFLPQWVAAAVVPISLFGWAGWRSEIGLRGAGLLLGYGLMIALFARADTFYWGLLMTPLLLAGSVLAVPSLTALGKNTAT